MTSEVGDRYDDLSQLFRGIPVISHIYSLSFGGVNTIWKPHLVNLRILLQVTERDENH